LRFRAPGRGHALFPSYAVGSSNLLADHQADKISIAGKKAARKRFSPEFINRIDKTVVFNPLDERQLREILGLEIQAVEERICRAISGSIILSVDPAAQDFLLREGTDVRYGARHLKRAVERLLVHPISNLLATAQLQTGDTLVVDFDSELNCLMYSKESRQRVPRRQGAIAASAVA
jgi:ATP-dependent Clp protease ATP-binding subunit ClpA